MTGRGETPGGAVEGFGRDLTPTHRTRWRSQKLGWILLASTPSDVDRRDVVDRDRRLRTLAGRLGGTRPGSLRIGEVVAVDAFNEQVLPHAGPGHELVVDASADLTGVGLDDDVVEAAAVEDALVVAEAGLVRLGIHTGEHPTLRLLPDWYLPAAGQGALAIETRQDGLAREIASGLVDEDTYPSSFLCILAI